MIGFKQIEFFDHAGSSTGTMCRERAAAREYVTVTSAGDGGPVRGKPHPPHNSVHEMCALAKRYAIEVGSTIVFLAFVLKTV
jgi:hypothetical protein